MSQQPSIHSFFPREERSKSTVCKAEEEDPDVSIVEVVPPKQKRMQWVASSFDGFGEDLMPSPAPRPSQQQSQSCAAVPVRAGMEQEGESGTIGRKRTREEGDFSRFFRARQQVRGLSRGARNPRRLATSGQLWLDRHQPSNKADLAVHKKKVEELEAALTQAFSASEQARPGGRVLLLTGPAGVGKTAAVKVLAHHLGAELQEWSNPLQPSFSSTSSLLQFQQQGELSRVEGSQFDSQTRQFENFLLRATKYQPLCLAGTQPQSRKVILVEDFPNVYLRDPAAFHQVVRKYQTSGHCPLVFVVSDSGTGNSNLRSLFPRELQEQSGLQVISFNPVAPTMMIKVLSRIATLEASQEGKSPPSQVVIESIAMSSAGDLRSAINSLQFACSQNTADLKGRPGLARRESSGRGRLKYGSQGARQEGEGGARSLGARDNSCFLFHAVGKVLYSKRGDPSEQASLPSLPPHLSDVHRDPLLLDPEEVVERSQAGADYFASFLHQNYLDFYTELEDVVQASSYFSDADFYSSDWTSRGTMCNYTASIATRGVIFSNSQAAHHNSSRPSLGWRPLHKSEWFSASKQFKENSRNAQDLFRSWHWEPKVLRTELIPFLNLISVPLHDPGQIAFVQEMASFPKRGNLSRRRLERLGETDLLTEGAGDLTPPSESKADEDGTDLSGSQSQVQHAGGPNSDEELIIEDYDEEEEEGC